MKGILTLVFTSIAAVASATVWVGYAGGVAAYDDSGRLIFTNADYRKPMSLAWDDERERVWFLDSYDYRLVCVEGRSGKEIVNVEKAAYAPTIATSNLKTYTLEKRPVEPSISLDCCDGGVWIADFYGHQIVKYDDAGRQVFTAVGFHEPFAVCALGDGFAWVSGGISTLDLVGPKGDRVLTQPGVNEARGLAYDAGADLVWVADYRNGRVLGVDRAGRLKKKITGVELPERLAFDGATGVLWVTTAYAGVVQIDTATEAIRSWVVKDESAAALDVDKNGNCWVAFPDEGEIRRYSPSGEVLTVISRLDAPVAVAAE